MINILEYQATPSDSVARIKERLGDTTGSPDIVLRYGQAVPKLRQYKYFTEQKIPCPPWTQDPDIAKEWWAAGEMVFARKRRITTRGEGITIIHPDLDWNNDEFLVYTKYIPSSREFRVNLFNHSFVNIREKLRMRGRQVNVIRNNENGYTTTHPNEMSSELQERIKDLALKASIISSSSFIGVDIIYCKDSDNLYVLEVNSAPAIQGSSVGMFVDSILDTF